MAGLQITANHLVARLWRIAESGDVSSMFLVRLLLVSLNFVGSSRLRWRVVAERARRDEALEHAPLRMPVVVAHPAREVARLVVAAAWSVPVVLAPADHGGGGSGDTSARACARAASGEREARPRGR